ncbi:hypothetical protein BST61_g11303 [Cercospora zeina]
MRVQTPDHGARRMALMALVNYAIALSWRMSAYIADILGLPSFTSTRGISVMAVMIISQTICHIALVFTIQRPDYPGRLFITGCITVSSIVILTMTHLLQERMIYELAQVLVHVLAMVALYALWQHIRTGFGRNLIMGIAIAWAAIIFCATARILYRNVDLRFRRTKSRTSIQVSRRNATVVLSIPLTRGWTVRPGQLEGSTVPIRAWVDGPYGGSCGDLDSFCTVILVASGLGIAAQLPYMKEIVRRSLRREGSTTELCLFWQADEHFDGDGDPVQPWLNDCIQEDSKQAEDQQILSIQMFARNVRDLAPDIKRSWNLRRTRWDDNIENIYPQLELKLSEARGKTLVLTSANTELRDRTREMVRVSGGGRAKYCAPPFQPFNDTPRTRAEASDDKTMDHLSEQVSTLNGNRSIASEFAMEDPEVFATLRAIWALLRPLFESPETLSNNGDWEVEAVLDHRCGSGGIEYKVSWVDTWEPATSLLDCKGAIGDYARAYRDQTTQASI